MPDFKTYADIYGEVQNLVDDDNSTVLTVIKQVINNVYADIIGMSKASENPFPWLINYDASLSTVASTRTTVITGALNAERIIKVSVDNQPCWPITYNQLEGGTKEGPEVRSPEYYWSTTNKTRPQHFLHAKAYTTAGVESNTFLWFPLPDAAYTIRFWYEYRVSPMSAVGDVPVLPPWAHEALVFGTLVQLPLFDVRVKVGPWDVLYNKSLAQLKAFVNHFVVNPGNVVPFAL